MVEGVAILLLGITIISALIVHWWTWDTPKPKSSQEERRDYYRNEYLKSDDWKRKRFVVLKRDNWKCVYCGAPATQVHHERYARVNIGKEPIEWLVSICKSCHELEHS
jgi:5-methylcytosine-specific restriction endonuclease McrA